MKIEAVLLERDVSSHPYTRELLSRLPRVPVYPIDKVEDVFGRVKKPYLQKRRGLRLFVGRKKGQLVKEAPDAYGLSGDKHYYFIHAYNCIYECQYCYLQGYFDSPDLVLFVNHEEILAAMGETLEKERPASVWYHAGEFGDSLALSSLTREWPIYWEFFREHPEAKLELRTKSIHISPLDGLESLPNVFISFSLSPSDHARRYDLKAPATEKRLCAIQKLTQRGFQIGIHFDPIIADANVFEDYRELIAHIGEVLPREQLAYVSLGMLRFSKKSQREVAFNYPGFLASQDELQVGFDGKCRYPRPVRSYILKRIHTLLIEKGIEKKKIYLCMEKENSTKDH